MALFSVVVPVYNAGKTIERCVESIIKSGGDDVEIVLVEDCGKDNAREKCSLLAEKYPRIFKARFSRATSTRTTILIIMWLSNICPTT